MCTHHIRYECARLHIVFKPHHHLIIIIPSVSLPLSQYIFSKRVIDIFFDFTVDFQATEDVSMQTASMTSGSGQANVDSYVSACKCDDLESFTCNNTPLAPNSILNVCIQSMDSDVEISFLSQLEMFQSNILGDETLLIVDGLVVQNNEISSLTIVNETHVGVSTVVPSRFFSYSGLSTATVSGIVQVKLVGPNRRLIEIGSSAFSSSRAMRGESVARPGRDGSSSDTPFEITIGMEPQSSSEYEISKAKSGFEETANSGSVIGGAALGATSLLLLIGTALGFFLW